MEDLKVVIPNVSERTKEIKFWHVEGTRSTICAIILDNGFVIIGQAHSIGHHEFSREKNEFLAKEDAERHAWSYLGFTEVELEHLGL